MSVPLGELFKTLPILKGGLVSVSAEELTGDEENKLRKFLGEAAIALDRISPKIASDFQRKEEFWYGLCKIAKSKFEKPFGGDLPASGEFGVGFLIPQDIRYVATASSTTPAYSDYSLNSWDISLTAGTASYLLGDGTHFYKARPTTGYRCVFGVMQDGIIEIGTTPSFNQFIVKTESRAYAAWSVHPLADLTIEESRPIYRYNTPFDLPVFYDFGVMLGGMPTVSGTKNVRLIGVIFYEYDHRASLTWVS